MDKMKFPKLIMFFIVAIPMLILALGAFAGDNSPPTIDRSSSAKVDLKKSITSQIIQPDRNNEKGFDWSKVKLTRLNPSGGRDYKTPITVSSSDGKASLYIYDWDIDLPVDIFIYNPSFSDRTGFFRVITVAVFPYPAVTTHSLGLSPYNFYGKITAIIDDTIMDDEDGVTQGGGNFYDSGDVDGQWENGWVTLDGDEASVPMGFGNTMYSLPNEVYIGPAMPIDDRDLPIIGAYSNDEVAFLMKISDFPDIGGVDDFEFLEISNPSVPHTTTLNGVGSVSVYPVDEYGDEIETTSGATVQIWFDSYYLSWTLRHSIYNCARAYGSYCSDQVVEADWGYYDWVWADTPYHCNDEGITGFLIYPYNLGCRW